MIWMLKIHTEGENAFRQLGTRNITLPGSPVPASCGRFWRETCKSHWVDLWPVRLNFPMWLLEISARLMKERSLKHIWPGTYIVRVWVQIIDLSNPSECFSPVVTSVWAIIQQTFCHFSGCGLTFPGSATVSQPQISFTSFPFLFFHLTDWIVCRSSHPFRTYHSHMTGSSFLPFPFFAARWSLDWTFIRCLARDVSELSRRLNCWIAFREMLRFYWEPVMSLTHFRLKWFFLKMWDVWSHTTGKSGHGNGVNIWLLTRKKRALKITGLIAEIIMHRFEMAVKILVSFFQLFKWYWLT